MNAKRSKKLRQMAQVYRIPVKNLTKAWQNFPLQDWEAFETLVHQHFQQFMADRG